MGCAPNAGKLCVAGLPKAGVDVAKAPKLGVPDAGVPKAGGAA